MNTVHGWVIRPAIPATTTRIRMAVDRQDAHRWVGPSSVGRTRSRSSFRRVRRLVRWWLSSRRQGWPYVVLRMWVSKRDHDRPLLTQRFMPRRNKPEPLEQTGTIGGRHRRTRRGSAHRCSHGVDSQFDTLSRNTWATPADLLGGPTINVNTTTTLAASGGRPRLGMAFKRSGVRLPPGPPLFRIQICQSGYHIRDIHTPV